MNVSTKVAQIFWFLCISTISVVYGLSFGGCSMPSEVADQAAKSSPFSVRSENSWANEAENDSIGGRAGNIAKGKLPNDRKIIFTAELTAIVEQLKGVDKKIEEEAARLGGYVSSGTMDSLSSYRPSGTWVVRIPVGKFKEFLSSAKSIGTVDDIQIESQDVTEEFFDSEARLKNQRKLEERILKLLERPEDEIQHVIKVEAELARVREVIERIEGRLRFLKDRVSFSTVTIKVIQQRSYVPKEKRTFSNRLSSAWDASWEDARYSGETLILNIVRNAPFWIFFVAVILPGAIFLYRWVRRRAASQTVEG